MFTGHSTRCTWEPKRIHPFVQPHPHCSPLTLFQSHSLLWCSWPCHTQFAPPSRDPHSYCSCCPENSFSVQFLLIPHIQPTVLFTGKLFNVVWFKPFFLATYCQNWVPSLHLGWFPNCHMICRSVSVFPTVGWVW